MLYKHIAAWLCFHDGPEKTFRKAFLKCYVTSDVPTLSSILLFLALLYFLLAPKSALSSTKWLIYLSFYFLYIHFCIDKLGGPECKLFFWLHLTWRHTVIYLPQQRQDNWTLISVSNLPLLLSALLVEIKSCYIAGEERMTDSKPMWIIKIWELFFSAHLIWFQRRVRKTTEKIIFTE